jgi:hypothetical protein
VSNTAYAAPTATVGAQLAPQNTSKPTISGTVQDGATLTANHGNWFSPLALTYKYRWQVCKDGGSFCIGTSYSTDNTYQLTSKAVGGMVTVTVQATDSTGKAALATSAAYGPVANPAPPLNTTAPVISGTPNMGLVLSVDTGRWQSPDSLVYYYQWRQCDSVGTNCTNITRGTGSSLTLLSGDAGHTIAVIVSATDQEKQTASQAAAAVGPVSS